MLPSGYRAVPNIEVEDCFHPVMIVLMELSDFLSLMFKHNELHTQFIPLILNSTQNVQNTFGGEIGIIWWEDNNTIVMYIRNTHLHILTCYVQ